MVLASLAMTQPKQLSQARESAQQTYDRRRARTAADTLALIPPNRWDDTTRRIIATLATISAPSRIDDVLVEVFDPDAYDGAPAEHLVELTYPADSARIAAAIDAYDGIECKHGVPGYRGLETCAEGGHDV